MQGNIGGYYSILGGLVSGRCNYKLTIGEKCEITGASALSGLQIIAETSPGPDERNITMCSPGRMKSNA
ncbi:unnamed protein product [marine sediment metagenome]|uniref:Uncharacterized protein n=1 Tax=marine sediment metagenome TaxID=412755 RepID=X1GEN0_9ZZZZ